MYLMLGFDSFELRNTVWVRLGSAERVNDRVRIGL